MRKETSWRAPTEGRWQTRVTHGVQAHDGPTVQRIVSGEKTVAELGLVLITTPAYRPESNGLAEAFVVAFKRDYLGDAELRDVETMLAQLSGWFDDYYTLAPHSALGMCSPPEYHALTVATASEFCQRRRCRRICPRTGDRLRGRYLWAGYSSKIEIEPTRASS